MHETLELIRMIFLSFSFSIRRMESEKAMFMNESLKFFTRIARVKQKSLDNWISFGIGCIHVFSRHKKQYNKNNNKNGRFQRQQKHNCTCIQINGQWFSPFHGSYRIILRWNWVKADYNKNFFYYTWTKRNELVFYVHT